MFLFKALEYIKLTLIMTKLNLLGELQYRANFILKIFGMFINDSVLTLMWIIFFKQFPNINGWTLEDSMLLIAIAWTSFFIVNFFFGGIFNLANFINTGKLDQNLLLPKSVIWQVATSSSGFWELGTFLVCLYMFYLSGYITLLNLPFLILLIITGAIITFNFIVCINTLAFYFGNIEFSLERIFRVLFDFVFYPQNIFTGILRVLTIFVVPTFFIAAIPVSLMKEFSFEYFAMLIAFVVIQTFFTRYFFKKGLERYESGNLINVRL